MAARRIVSLPLRATLLAALAACTVLGLPIARASHAREHEARPTLVAAPPTVAAAAADHDDAACPLCQTLAAADQPLTPHAMATLPLPMLGADTLVATRRAESAPSGAPVHADARAPPRG